MEIDLRLLRRRIDVLERRIQLLEAERDETVPRPSERRQGQLTARIKGLHHEQLATLRTMHQLVETPVGSIDAPQGAMLGTA